MIIEESVCFMSCEPIFFGNYSYVVYMEYIYIFFFFINWTVCMSDNLPERVQILGHMHIICITVRENIIICCQIFCDLFLKSAFERIFNVMQLILVKIKWKYLIQKFHDICLSYYFNSTFNNISVISGWSVSLVVISTDCTGICKSNSHTITTMMTSSARRKNPPSLISIWNRSESQKMYRQKKIMLIFD